MSLCIQAVIVRRKKIVSLAIQTASSESLKKNCWIAHADFNLRWAHICIGTFSDVTAQLYLSVKKVSTDTRAFLMASKVNRLSISGA